MCTILFSFEITLCFESCASDLKITLRVHISFPFHAHLDPGRRYYCLYSRPLLSLLGAGAFLLLERDADALVQPPLLAERPGARVSSDGAGRGGAGPHEGSKRPHAEGRAPQALRDLANTCGGDQRERKGLGSRVRGLRGWTP